MEGTLQLGGQAKVEAMTQPDGSLLASHIVIEAPKRTNDRDNDNRPTPAAPAPSPAPPVSPPAAASPSPSDPPSSAPSPSPSAPPSGQPQLEAFRFSGVLTELAGSRWVVGDQTVLVTRETRITGTPVVGLTVDVQGNRARDGRVTATAITVHEQPAPRSGDNRAPGGQGTGDRPAQRDPAEEESGPSPGTTVRVQGAIESLTATQWVVDKRLIVVDNNTRAEGAAPAVGLRARVDGKLQRDGRILATAIRVLPAPPQRSQGDTPTPRASVSPSPSPSARPSSSPPASASPSVPPAASPPVSPSASPAPSPSDSSRVGGNGRGNERRGQGADKNP